MSFSLEFIATFGVLAAAVIALWIPAPEIRGARSWLWAPLLGLACLVGVLTGFLAWFAPIWLVLYGAGAILAKNAKSHWLRVPSLAVTWIAPFLFATHRFPGFTNPILASGIEFSLNAPAYTMRVNFDMAAVGVILAGVFCERIRTVSAWRLMLRQAGPVIVSTLIIVLGLGMLSGFVRPDLKWTPYSVLFLALNLLFICVTEEAFFRGFTFAGLSRYLSRWRFGTAAAAMISSTLFGIAHIKGGALLVVLATVAGLHYAFAYIVTRRLEAAILTHFALNAVHFVAFTYPNLLR